MKKLFTLLILSMSFAFFACSSDSDKEPAAPGVPTDLQIKSSIEEITISWEAPQYDGELIYDIYLQEAGGDNLMREIKKVTTTSFTYPVKYMGLHTFKVRARAFTSATSASEFVEITTTIEAPEPPSLFTDLRALQQILDKNPDNTLGWEFDLTDKTNPKIIKGEGSSAKSIAINNGRVTQVDTSDGNITDLEDIKALGALQRLLCRGSATHKLKTLDISKNRELVYLICSGNELTTLDISNQPNMWAFNAGNNKLESIDVSNNLLLSTFNVANNTNLTSIVFTAEHTRLGNLNFTGLPAGSVSIPQAVFAKIATIVPKDYNDPVYKK